MDQSFLFQISHFSCLVLTGATPDPCYKVNCSHYLASCQDINGTATCVCSTAVTLDLRYVCGSDGKTYPNHRSLEVASCLAGGAIKKVKDGKCKSYCPTFRYSQKHGTLEKQEDIFIRARLAPESFFFFFFFLFQLLDQLSFMDLFCC